VDILRRIHQKIAVEIQGGCRACQVPQGDEVFAFWYFQIAFCFIPWEHS